MRHECGPIKISSIRPVDINKKPGPIKIPRIRPINIKEIVAQLISLTGPADHNAKIGRAKIIFTGPNSKIIPTKIPSTRPINICENEAQLISLL
jgi:hypothetical protein